MSGDRFGSLAGSLPLEVRFLIAAASADLRPSVQAAAMTPDAWRSLPAAAHRHGLAALLARGLEHRPDAPASVRAAAHAAARGNAVNGLRGMSELVRVLEALQHGSIPCAALKGPAFSRWLYGDLGFRRFGDLDVLIPGADLQRAHTVLAGLGYRLAGGMTVKTARTIHGALGAWPLAGGGVFPVDLHWRLAHIRFAMPITAADVIDRSIGLDAGGGRRTPIPCATHAALLTLLHASKHLWGTLELLLAIARLLERDDVEWEAVRAMARGAGVWRGCETGLMLASALFGVELPPEIRQDRPAAADQGGEQREALAALRLPAGVFQERWAERRAHRASFDRWRGRVRYDLWRLVAPTPLEFDWCPLPDRLTALYVPLRLVRLGVAAVTGALRPAVAPLSETAAAPVAPDDDATPSIHDVRESPRRSV